MFLCVLSKNDWRLKVCNPRERWWPRRWRRHRCRPSKKFLVWRALTNTTSLPLSPLSPSCLKGCFSPLIGSMWWPLWRLLQVAAKYRGYHADRTRGKGEGKDSNSHAKSSRDFTITILVIITTIHSGTRKFCDYSLISLRCMVLWITHISITYPFWIKSPNAFRL